MTETIQESPFTFTSDRVRQILQENLCPKRPANARGYPSMFDPVKPGSSTGADGKLTYLTEQNRRERVNTWCKEYRAKLDTLEGYLERLESAFSEILCCNFQMAISDVEDIIQRTCKLLSRLPAVPPNPGLQLEGPTALEADLFLPGSPHTWENLRVVRFVDINTIRLALAIVIDEDSWYGSRTVDLLDHIGELAQLAFQASPQGRPVQQTLLAAYLWTSLHRGIMIHFSYILTHQLSGYDYHRNSGLALQAKDFLQKVHRLGAGLPEMPECMCRCAFELLRSDRAAMAHDFRAFHKRYSEALGGRPARCIVSEHGTKPCAGDIPHDCMRFRGGSIVDQSAHAASCVEGCPRLFWSEESYRGVSGARAVCLKETVGDTLVYRQASERTMAVSHVWSHGQGGRPEREGGTGFNKCLHNRYKSIAQAFDCDSYWMDTPCIPQDHRLRFEAISHINNVFRNSKLTLVCDKDIMSIDATNLDLDVHERILAVILVCDWNVRAWTLLEAMRGRHSIWLLCKNDRIVSFREVLENVHRHGSLTLSNLLLTSQHLLPAPRSKVPTQVSGGMKIFLKGYVSIEEAAMLLSHRHATRQGDEIVIWGLLVGESVPKNALEFWKARVETTTAGLDPSFVLPTGFLVSSVPRVRELGWSWAPVRPDMPEEEYRKGRDRIHFHQDGADTNHGYCVGEGLRAEWLIGEFPGQRISSSESIVRSLRSLVFSQDQILGRISCEYLKDDRWGALLTPIQGVDLRVIRRSSSGQLLFPVVGTNDESRQRWIWRGVVELKAGDLSSLPKGVVRRIFLL